MPKASSSGGANGLRGWIACSLGLRDVHPQAGVRFDQIGDIKLEYNCEYRFPVYKFFESAIFADAGNVWLRRKDESRPLADFRFYRFYKEIAMDAGLASVSILISSLSDLMLRIRFGSPIMQRPIAGRLDELL
ncbi:MAG: BamA/TamA family outer membrane protein [Bacteroidia bacterium]